MAATDRQHDLANTLKYLIKQANINANILAREIHLPPPTIHRLITGEVQDPKISTMNAIANYFSVSTDQLLGKEPLETNFSSKTLHQQIAAIPVFTLYEAADYEHFINSASTTLNWASQNKEHEAKIDKNLFSVILRNDLYDPPFASGTYLIINPNIAACTGDYVLVKFAGDSVAVIKKYIAEGKNKYLYPLQQELKTITFDEETSSIVGVIIASYRNFKN